MKCFFGGIVLLLVASVAFHASAQTETLYEGNSNGNFSDPNNWTDGVPNANSDALVSTGADFTGVGVTGTANDSNTITISSTTNQSAAGLFISASFNVDTFATIPGVVNLNFSPGTTFTIGQNFAEGISVSNQATLNFSGGTINLVSGDIILGEQPAEQELTGLGAFNITGGTLSAGNSILYAGFGDSSTGFFTESGSGTTVTVESVLAGSGGSTGTINLQSGTFSSGGVVDIGAGGTGTLNQNGGTMNVGATLFVGDGGTGFYNLTAGTANISSDFTIASDDNSSGSVNQTGGTVNVTGTTSLGANGGTGSYTINGGRANFNGGLTLGGTGTGTFVQGGDSTVVVADGEAITFGSANSSYSLRGGSLTIGADGISGNPGDGSFNLGGGELITHGDVTDNLNGTLTGNSTINSGGTLILSGTLTGTGALAITAGTVQASTANLPNISGVTLRTGSTFNLTTSGNATDTFTGTISGTGNLQTGNTGQDNLGNPITAPVGYRLVIPNPINLTGGTTTIANGTALKVASGTLSTLTGGAGTSLEIGSAAGGTISILGTATVPTITVDNNSGLRAGNVVGSIVNQGTLGTLTPLSTLAITGSLNQPQEATVAAEGTLIVHTNGTTSDVYTANTANLFGRVQVIGVGSNTYNIVITNGLTTGTLNVDAATGLFAQPNTELFSSTLTQVGNNLQLTTVQGNLLPFGQTTNERNVAGAIDTVIQRPPVSFAPLLQSLNNLPGAGISSALHQLTPETYTYMRDIAFENTTFLAQRVGSFLDNLRTGYSGLDTTGLSVLGPGLDSQLGRSLGSLLAYNNEAPAPNGVNYYPDQGGEESAPLMVEPSPAGPATISDSVDPRMAPTQAPPPSTSVFDGNGVGFNEFISGDVSLGELNQDNSGSSQPKAHYVAGNATAGVSFRINPNIAAGVLFDYNHTDALTSAQGSHVRVDSYSPGLFATYFRKGFYANGLFTFGYNDYSNDRHLAFAGTTAHSSPNGEQYAPNIDAGYDFHPDRQRQWTIGPTAGIGYTHLDVDSFQESGAGPADLSVDSQSADSLRARLGGRVIYLVRAGDVVFQPHLTLSYQHEFLNDPYHLTSQLNIPGTPSFNTLGGNPGRETGLIGLGLTATLANSMNIYLEYLAEIGGDDYFVQNIEGGFKASF